MAKAKPPIKGPGPKIINDGSDSEAWLFWLLGFILIIGVISITGAYFDCSCHK